ncbi:MAG: TetR/AcrR family transcriptional regulator [Aeromicrobium erythreum]
MASDRPRQTQEQRRARTRGLVLDAAVACLLEQGYAATSIAEVQERAGVARGTLLHHFPTKNALVVGAVEHLAARRIDRFAADAALVPASTDRLSALVDLAWSGLSSPEFFTAAELWMAARTDEDLRAALRPVETATFARLQESLTSVLGPPHADDPRTPTLVTMTIELLTGLSLSTMLAGDLVDRATVLERWKRVLAVSLGDLSPDRLLDRGPA